MCVDSYHYAPRKHFDRVEQNARRGVVVKPVTEQAVGAVDDADEGLSKRTDPGLHGANIPPAWLGAKRRVRVQKTDNVPPLLFAGERPRPVELDAGRFANGSRDLPRVPDATAALTDKHPRLLPQFGTLPRAVLQWFGGG